MGGGNWNEVLILSIGLASVVSPVLSLHWSSEQPATVAV